MDFQFFPTPKSLARRLWAKFKNRDFVRVLDPEGGCGDLLDERPWANEYRHRNDSIPVDTCEIDISKHAVLQSKFYNVVGTDFMQFSNGAIYSHIVMNPPFAEGAKHVLKAWDILWCGEIAAIVNAETLKNPFSAERKRLLNLILKHGDVEYATGEFTTPETQRKTEVEVALIYLNKEVNIETDITGNLFDELRADLTGDSSLGSEFEQQHNVALPNTVIENNVLAFNAAVKAMKEAVAAQAKADYYANFLGDTMAVRNGDKGKGLPPQYTRDYVIRATGRQYDELKDRAWAAILRSSNVTDKLSSKAQKRVEAEFERIKKLEFTVTNVYGFLLGIVQSQGEIQIEMACDIFDQITGYTENGVFYRGYWKSNDKHRTLGMRIKMTRFIIPYNRAHSNGLDWDSEKRLSDFDKVFAMVDGKVEPEFSLVQLFRDNFHRLRCGERMSSSYFDVRYFPGIGTIHYFPRDKKLIDRFNRLVGQHRKWLPPEGEPVSDAFWKQYDKAEKFDAEVHKEIAKMASGGSYWANPLHKLHANVATADRQEAMNKIDQALANVQDRHGINIDAQLEHQQQPQMLLAA